TGKGGKNRRRGKNENESEKRELVFKEDGQEYAQVIKMLGNGRLEAMCFDGVKRLCHIRGKLRKKVWINTSDIILVGLRDYQDNKADVILKYNADEARSLKAYGELPEHGEPLFSSLCPPGGMCVCSSVLPLCRRVSTAPASRVWVRAFAQGVGVRRSRIHGCERALEKHP
ncbi:IF1AX factor, partial [Amia calva]|nr:IF1AX factor [Amia calva]